MGFLPPLYETSSTKESNGKVVVHMSTSVLQTTAPGPASRRVDRTFVYALVAIIVATVLLGFAKTYFSAGVFGAMLL